MKKTLLQLPGKYYFSQNAVPIALRQVRGKTLSHPHDYTGVPHWHDFSELVIITGGTGRQNINGVSYPVSAGDVFVIAGKTTHFFEEYGSLSIANIMFSDSVFRGVRESLNRIPGYHLIFRFEPELRTGRAFHNTLHLTRNALSYVMTVLRKMETEFANSAPGCEAAAASALLELIVFLSRASREKKADKSVSRLAGLFGTLEASFREEWTLARMAKYASMSVNTLLRTFRAAAKQTPLHYLNSLRLNAASLLLLDSDRSISEIAFSCGFHDSNYFTKKFRNAFGITPGAFRKKHREESR